MMMDKVVCFKKITIALGVLFGTMTYAQSADKLFEPTYKPSTLTERWDLDKESKRNTFTISPYKPIYILPGLWSSGPNNQPISTKENPTVPKSIDYNHWEAKFQISFKTKVLDDFLFGKGDLWLGYTQTANWQVYNDKVSRPFRELNYEPELIFNYPLDLSINDFKFKMAGLALNHQSNGKSLPTSRSWNRVIMHVGMEYKNWTFMLKPWVRIHEKVENDDNPQIEEYIGKGELLVVYTKDNHVLTLKTRNNLRFNSHYKGFHEFTWAYPIKNNLKAFLAVTNGYGETLIDYNWNQTTIGVGISLVEWL